MRQFSCVVYINKKPFPAKLEQQEDGTWIAEASGKFGFGDTSEEAADNLGK